MVTPRPAKSLPLGDDLETFNIDLPFLEERQAVRRKISPHDPNQPDGIHEIACSGRNVDRGTAKRILRRPERGLNGIKSQGPNDKNAHGRLRT